MKKKRKCDPPIHRMEFVYDGDRLVGRRCVCRHFVTTVAGTPSQPAVLVGGAIWKSKSHARRVGGQTAS